MSNQVIRLGMHRRLRAVEIISAGDEQLVTCNPIVYLEATVEGNLNNHTTEWVQITGTPIVTLFQTSPTQAYYLSDINNIGTDKLFRFYIDRNTQIEQHTDMLIRTTPVDRIYAVEIGALPYNVAVDPNSLSQPATIDGDFSFAITPFNSKGQVVTDSFLTWGLPIFFTEPDSVAKSLYSNNYIGSTLEVWNGTSWVEHTFFPPGSQRTFLLDANYRLRHGNVYNLPGKGIVKAYNDWMDYTASTGGNLVRGKEVLATINHGVVETPILAIRNIFVLSALNEIEAVDSINLGKITNERTLTRTVFIIEPLTQTDNAYQVEHGVIGINVSLTRSSAGAVGG